MTNNSQLAVPPVNANTEAAKKSTQKRDVYLTGFGKFGDILENPTTSLAKKLAEHPKVTESHVLEVSKTGSAEVLKKLHARAEERGRLCILLHFGVSANSRTLKLEQVGYNVADFRVPDERGYVAKDEIIREGEPDKIYTNVPLDDLQKMLQPICSHISISTDPGRYICNYVYFRSLVWIIHRKAMGFPETRLRWLPRLWISWLKCDAILLFPIVVASTIFKGSYQFKSTALMNAIKGGELLSGHPLLTGHLTYIPAY